MNSIKTKILKELFQETKEEQKSDYKIFLHGIKSFLNEMDFILNLLIRFAFKIKYEQH